MRFLSCVFASDVADMGIDRARTDEDFLPDLAIGVSASHATHHIQLALGQAARRGVGVTLAFHQRRCQ